ncbi:exodeoxyribonuclease V subunit gamma [Candidatus Pandoraea novymonadis]|uniref:RecBCD enzyme subunit RecC n=1 Tax=Candidatus Pandoraea novymonadis TaxID=1808959 RepID=A0ABX5FEG3_9BURK|nr:exodeoxyribonuclease V subunit gamma [Candidatus Pandoraea novymonadis]PSB91681.1 RecBCD enzyme subunit RecC [Candidatus Pandoraea novymonadis]
MLKFFFSNRFDTLEAALLRDLADIPTNPLEGETIVVPSIAIRRRLELDYASVFGICTNVKFFYLAQWLWTMFGELLRVPESSPFAPDRLVWPIYQCLTEPWVAKSPRLVAYLNDADDVMRFELADHLAHIYDQYLTYRPDWLECWCSTAMIKTGGAVNWTDTQRDDECWQAELWRRVLVLLNIQEQNPTLRAIDAIEQLLPNTLPLGWPSRVSVFALSSIPPLSRVLLKVLSRVIDINLYVFNPCESYWFDIVPQKQLSYLKMRGDTSYLEVGHPLLAEWGQQTQAHIDLLYTDLGAHAFEDRALFHSNPRRSVLAAFQNGILSLDDGSHGTPYEITADGTIEVNICHSLARQIEVLHDRLLAYFDSMPDLKPDEILVTVPNLECAAPLIDSVFGAAKARIPYSITGLSPTRMNPVARALTAILSLPKRRVAVSDLIELACTDALALRYKLNSNALDLIQNWLHVAGARRGWRGDALQRLEGNDPHASNISGGIGMVSHVESHTLGDAMMRLFLGYALPDGALPVDDWLPIGGIEGSRAELLGNLARLIDDLDITTRALEMERTAVVWRDYLIGILEHFFCDEVEHAKDFSEVRLAIEKVSYAINESTPNITLPVAVIVRVLEKALDYPAYGGVPSGRVTFAPMPSLHLLPYRVVCMLGMDEAVLPGPMWADEFDLMRAFPQRGDRQRRDEERNLFLDLLLAAQDCVWIGYTGRGMRDNVVLPPSTAVDELLDFLASLLAPSELGFDAEARGLARRQFIIEHPLQPFSTAYFDGENASALYSYDEANADVARALLKAEDSSIPRFVTKALPVAVESTITLDDLIRFWRHPGRAWARARLGLMIFEPVEFDNNEPFLLDWAGRNALAARLLPRLLADSGDGDTSMRVSECIARVSHEFPAGAMGTVWRNRELIGLHRFSSKVRDAKTECTGEALVALTLNPNLPLEWTSEAYEEWSNDATLFAPCLLQARLATLTPQGLVMYRYGPCRATDLLGAWLSHLALCAYLSVKEDAIMNFLPHTQWFGYNDSFSFKPVVDAKTLLGNLIAFYRLGQTLPLPFFPRTSSSYARNASVKEAAAVWEGSNFAHGDSDDSYTKLIWRGVSNPIGAEFRMLARVIYGPLIAHLES